MEENRQNTNGLLEKYIQDKYSICREERQYALYLHNYIKRMISNNFKEEELEEVKNFKNVLLGNKDAVIENVFYEATFMRDLFEYDKRRAYAYTAYRNANEKEPSCEELEEERDNIISTSGTTAEAILNYNKESSDEYIAWNQAKGTYDNKAQEVEDGAVVYAANKTALADVVRELETATGDEKTQLETQKTNLEIKIKNHEDLVTERDRLETDLKTKKTALDENDAKMVKAQEDLRAVDEELREVRSEINEAILDMADG